MYISVGLTVLAHQQTSHHPSTHYISELCNVGARVG